MRFTGTAAQEAAGGAADLRQFLPSQVARSAEKHPRRSLQRLIGRTAFGGAVLLSCLQAGAASALSFNFSFTGDFGLPTNPGTVTGTITGLVDNLSSQKTGLTATITSATNAPIGGWDAFGDSDYVFGNGFNVSGGQVTGVDIIWTNASGQTLKLGNLSVNSPELFNQAGDIVTYEYDSSSSNGLLFAPVAGPPGPASVPGPLPLFGAGAAFGWSRRLRRRIKSPA